MNSKETLEKGMLRFVENPLVPTEAEKSDMKIFEAMVGEVNHTGVRTYLKTHFLSALRMRLEDKVADDPILRKDLDEEKAYRWKQIIQMASNIRELEAVGIL